MTYDRAIVVGSGIAGLVTSAALARHFKIVTLIDRDTISSEQQSRIVGILSKIDASADALGAGSVNTNHLVIDNHIDQFKSSVSLALRNAQASPPNYFELGKLAGSCVACHKYR